MKKILLAALLVVCGAPRPGALANGIDFSVNGGTAFRPRGPWSGFAESGLYWQKLRLSFLYEVFRFARSPAVAVGNLLYFQPDSSSDIFGLTVGRTFR